MSVWRWVLAGVLGVGVVGCKPKSAERPAPPPAEVTYAMPVVKEVIDWDEYPGRLEAVEFVEVRARVGGFIETAPFEEGSVVKAGDVLFTLDVRPMKAQLEQAEADRLTAIAQRDQAKVEYERVLKLLPTRAVSEQEVDTRRQQWKAREAMVEAAEASVQAAELNVEFATVTAPIGGRIGRKLVTPGNLVNGGAGNATLLTTITSRDPVYCYVDVDERTVQRYRQMAVESRRRSARELRIPAYVGLATESGFPHLGSIDFVDNRVNPNTGTLQARAVLPNEDDLLQPGYFARLRVPAQDAMKVTLISDVAIGLDQTQKYVLVLNAKDEVEYRKITTGKVFDGLRAVEGLEAGERVIVSGLMRIRPGMKVNAKAGEMPVMAGTRSGDTPTDPAKMPPALPKGGGGSTTRPRA
jgi:multidrug efflux system membrane fusion protein